MAHGMLIAGSVYTSRSSACTFRLLLVILNLKTLLFFAVNDSDETQILTINLSTGESQQLAWFAPALSHPAQKLNSLVERDGNR